MGHLHSITHSYYCGAAGALIIYDVTSSASFLQAKEWRKDVRAHTDPNLLVANKVDLVPEGEESASACSMKVNTRWLSALEKDRKRLAYAIGIGGWPTAV